jgi:hypothetical protein
MGGTRTVLLVARNGAESLFAPRLRVPVVSGCETGNIRSLEVAKALEMFNDLILLLRCVLAVTAGLAFDRHHRL